MYAYKHTYIHTYIPYQTIHIYIHSYIHTYIYHICNHNQNPMTMEMEVVMISPLHFGRSEVEEVLHRAGLKMVSCLPTAYASPFDEMNNYYDLKEKYQSHGCLCLFSYYH